MRFLFIVIILSFCMCSEIFRAQVLDNNQRPITNDNVELILDNLILGSVTDDDGFFFISSSG